MKYCVDRLVAPLNATEKEIRTLISRDFRIPENSFYFQLVKRRTVLVNNRPMMEFDLIVDTLAFVRNPSLHFFEGYAPLTLPPFSGKGQPIVIGSGFTGLLCAYLLAKVGAKPLVLEQGEKMAEREKTRAFLEARKQMVPESNYRNGEGGSFASLGGYIEQGTDLARNEFLLQTFREIGLSNYPEIEGFRFCSSADLSRACSVMKTFIESRGGSFRYGARIVSVERFLGWPKAVTYLQDGSRKTAKASSVILATGASGYSIKAAQLCRVPLKIATPSIGLFIECNGRDFETEYYGRGKTGKVPPLFVTESFPNRMGREIRLSFAYPNSELVNGSCEEGSIDLRLRQNTWSGNGNAIAVLSVSLVGEEAEKMSLDGSLSFGGSFLRSCFRRDRPYAGPAETLGDFLSKKEPLLFGDVRPSCRDGVYLTNLHRFLTPALDDAITYGLYQAGRKFPLLARSGDVLTGFSTLGTSRYLPDSEFVGMRGLFSALPRMEDGRDLMKAGERALRAVESLLREN